MSKQYLEEERFPIDFLEDIFEQWHRAVELLLHDGRFDSFAITNSYVASIITDDKHLEAPRLTRRQILATWQAARDKKFQNLSSSEAKDYIHRELLHEDGIEGSFTNDQLTQANDILMKFRDAAIIDQLRAEEIMGDIQQAIGRLRDRLRSAPDIQSPK